MDQNAGMIVICILCHHFLEILILLRKNSEKICTKLLRISFETANLRIVAEMIRRRLVKVAQKQTMCFSGVFMTSLVFRVRHVKVHVHLLFFFRHIVWRR